MTTVTIKNIFLDQSTQTQSGFGFIHFETIEGARNAVNGGGSCIQIGGVNYNAEFSKHLMKRGEKKMTNSHTGTQPSVVPSLPIPEVPWGPPSPRYHTQFPSGHYALYPVPITILLLFSLMTGIYVLSIAKIIRKSLSNAL